MRTIHRFVTDLSGESAADQCRGMTTTLHVKGPADVIAVLPYELGYHPVNSLVVVALHGNRLGLRARVDLPPPAEAGPTVAQLLGPLLDSGAQDVLLIGYEKIDGASRPALDAMSTACVDAGLGVRDRLVVRDGRWYDLDCTSADCCPPQGRPVPGADEVAAVAEFVAREKQPVADRAALAAWLRPARPLLAGAVDAAASRWLDRRLDSIDRPAEQHDDDLAELRAWGRLLDHSDEAVPVAELTPEELAMAAVSLVDIDLRDGLIAWLCPGTLGFDRAAPEVAAQLRAVLPPVPTGDDLTQAVSRQRIEARLIELCRCLSPEWAVAPLTVLASFTWWRGDGALTRLALEQALESDPSYRLALLLLRMVDLSIRPETATA